MMDRLMNWPRVSIIVITRNEERNISECLQSLLSIEYPKSHYEIIVVDSSDDRTPDLVKQFPVRLIRLKERGFGVARNTGISYARFDLVAFTDADCIVPKDWIRKLAIRFDSGVGGVGGNAFPPPASPYLGKCIACLGFPAGGALGLDEIYHRIGKNLEAIGTCNAIFRRDILIMVGGFDDNLRYGGEDQDIGHKIREKGFCLTYEKDSFVYHRTRSSLREFLSWNTRRGYAKAWAEMDFRGPERSEGKAPFLLSNVLKASLRKRKAIRIGLTSIVLAIPFLFLMKQSVMLTSYLKAKKVERGNLVRNRAYAAETKI